MPARRGPEARVSADRVFPRERFQLPDERLGFLAARQQQPARLDGQRQAADEFWFERRVHRDGPDARRAAADLFARLHTRRVSVRFVGVRLSNLRPSNCDQLELFGEDKYRSEKVCGAVDEIRRRYGFAAIASGKSLDLIGTLRKTDDGFVLRTPSLTK